MLDRIPWNSQNYQASIQRWAIIGTPASRCWTAFSDIWILSPLKRRKKRCQSSDPDQIRMEFRKECFVNFNIWTCNRKHAKHQYCSISDFVVQKPMRTRSISTYHFQHRYMIFFEITKRLSLSPPPLSLSLSLPPALKVCK